MDQYTPRDDADTAPPPEPGGADAPAWDQHDQAAGQDQSQASAGTGQDAAAQYAAWSADTALQQQGQGLPAPPAYAAPEPQSATYGEQPQGYEQQQPYYDAAAYAQQQQAYAQQQQAYAQQQQAYPQQQQAYPQQQWQQPYYDQGAYGQQPSYYDQQGYAQQQWQQGYQQPAQPYAYAQPGQQPWPTEDQYWDQSATGYGRSFVVVLAGFLLLTWGLVFGLAGGLVMWLGSLDEIVAGFTLDTEVLGLVEEFNKQASAYGAILLILGIMQLIGGVGILAHRTWGRAFGVVLGLLGTIWGIGLLLSAVRLDLGDFRIQGLLAGDEPALGGALIVLLCYALIFLSMFVGRRHFRRKGVG
jgi:hypothetical protein